MFTFIAGWPCWGGSGGHFQVAVNNVLHLLNRSLSFGLCPISPGLRYWAATGRASLLLLGVSVSSTFRRCMQSEEDVPPLESIS